MKCEKCKKNEAKIHFTQIKDGKVVSHNLCKECAEKQGFKTVKFDSQEQPVFAPEPKEQVLSDLIDDEQAGDSPPLECPFCKSKLDDIKETGRMGCGKCYYTFENQIDMLLRRIQGSSFHLGERSGKPMSELYDDQLKVRELKKQLNESVKDEDYEEAARLRDEIKALEERLGEEK
ncbi:MAG: UvrB/UvrC motif-containing protein [Gemmatimonadota bacterium]|nr:UvrB/UvrC motif-containing protein [Gemmatimonadota bacterium]